MSDRLFIAWQEEATRAWHTIARVTRESHGYELVFTRGIEKFPYLPMRVFRMDPKYRYRFDELISLFTNKIPSKSRPDFSRMAGWLNLRGDESQFDLVAKFGLIPGTDSVLIYPEPDIVSGRYSVDFFIHGMRHMHRDVVSWCDKIREGDRLLPVLDVQNPVDPCAVALRSAEQPVLVGYVPAFYAKDIRALLENQKIASGARIEVVRNNRDAPLQLRMLCQFSAPSPVGFSPLDWEDYQPTSALSARDETDSPRGAAFA